MNYTFKPAAYEPQVLQLAFCGPSGSGKTMSALAVARGLVGPNGKIYGCDTENKRMLRYRHSHYQNRFIFDYCQMEAPYGPLNYLAMLQAAAKAGADALIVDSGSHEWIGIGGMSEMHENALAKMVGDKHWLAEKLNALAWKEPKQEHKKLMVWATGQAPMHIIWCLRAEPKLKVVTEIDEQGKKKTRYIDAGFQPICEKMFVYEMTASVMLSDENPGKPIPIKIPDELKDLFPTDKFLDEETGRRLYERNAEIQANKQAAAGIGTAGEGTVPTGKLKLIGSEGAVVGNYASGATWLAGLERALTDAGSTEAAGRIWDNNSDLFYRIQASATEKGDKKAIDKLAEVGRLAIKLSTPPQEGTSAPAGQGDLLGGAR